MKHGVFYAGESNSLKRKVILSTKGMTEKRHFSLRTSLNDNLLNEQFGCFRLSQISEIVSYGE